MNSAEVYSVRAQTSRGVVWKWRAQRQKKISALSFACYEDCVADAQKNGYHVEPLRPQ